MKKRLFLLCGMLVILIFFTGCSSNDSKYNNEIFTESLLDSITEIDYYYGGEKIVIKESSTIKEFYGYLSALKLEKITDSIKEGQQAIDLVTRDKTILLDLGSNEITVDSKTYSTDQDITECLRTIAGDFRYFPNKSLYVLKKEFRCGTLIPNRILLLPIFILKKYIF